MDRLGIDEVDAVEHWFKRLEEKWTFKSRNLMSDWKVLKSITESY